MCVVSILFLSLTIRSLSLLNQRRQQFWHTPHSLYVQDLGFGLAERSIVSAVVTWYLNHGKTRSIPETWLLVDNILPVIQRKGSRVQSWKENTSATKHFGNLRNTLLTSVLHNIK